jgi:predicted nucleic acid-binding protein
MSPRAPNWSARRARSAKRSWPVALIVVDASALIDLLLELANAGSVEDELRANEGDLHAPHLVDAEVLSGLRRANASGVANGRAREMLADFLDLPIERYPHTLLAPRIWELRHNFTPFDATYVALAEALADDAPLLTSDRRLAKAVRKHTDVRVLLAA